MKGKVTVINSLLASLLQYPTSVIYTPPRVIKEYKKIILSFLWNNKSPKVDYRTLILPIERGGLKLMDLESRIQVNILQWIKRIINNPDSNAANTFISLSGTSSPHFYFAPKRGPKSHWTKEHKFYSSAVKVWDSYHGFEPTSETEVKAEIIWHNKHIVSEGGPIQGGEWKRAGINRISDLCHHNTGRFFSHTEVAAKYNVSCNFLDLLRVRLSIPLHWRGMLTEIPTTTVNQPSDFEVKVKAQDTVDASTIGAKAMYSLINEGADTVSTAFYRWTEDRDAIMLNSREEWKDTCRSSFQASRETKLQSFHFKVIHRI